MDIFAFVLPFFVEMNDRDVESAATYDGALLKKIWEKLNNLAAVDRPYAGCVVSKKANRFQESATVFDDFFHYQFDSRKGRFDEATAQTYNIVAVGPYENDDYYRNPFNNSCGRKYSKI